ncbi:MAG: hypothetical protein NC110_04325 [Ruminococcus sp.]|nr:hypothetical protein [Ruminococcus sp.]
MSEQKKKKKRYPKLSDADQLIYKGIGVVLLITDALILWLSFFSVMHKKFFVPGVMAVTNQELRGLTLPLTFYLLIVGCICLVSKKPIIGNKKINYLKLKAKYHQVMPVFDKRYINRNRIILFCTKVIAFLVVGIVAVIMFNASVTSRTEISQSGIDKYSATNVQSAHYEFDDITEYKLYIDTLRYGFLDTPLFKHDAELYVSLKFDDGKTLLFNSENFKDVQSLRQTDKLIGNKHKTADSTGLDSFINCRSFTDEEKEIIRELFKN